jgi:molybdate transport system ATP-binding protein
MYVAQLISSTLLSRRLSPHRLLARQQKSLATTTSVSSSSSTPTPRRQANKEGLSGATDTLVRLRHERLGYSSSSAAAAATTKTTAATRPSFPHHHTVHVDLDIKFASYGGHALLGRNGVGKSLIAQSLQQLGKPIVSMQHVSFESHQALLQHGGSVSKALAHYGNLNKAAQFLVVRFGLYPLLHQDVRTLSNGQIKKVLIVRALSLRPDLLILDNAFDGLDVPSRSVLKELVSKTIRGFATDILVQGVSAKNTARTQVLLVTQRAEEIVDEITTYSHFDRAYESNSSINTYISSNKNDSNNPSWLLVTDDRGDRSAADIVHHALQMDGPALMRLPDSHAIHQWWRKGGPLLFSGSKNENPAVVVDMRNVSVERNGKRLLIHIDWQVLWGQRWIIGGLNGAGKSTLSRLLALPEDGEDSDGALMGDLRVFGLGPRQPRSHLGWVSTERHLTLAQSHLTVGEVLTMHLSTAAASSSSSWSAIEGTDESWRTVAHWLEVDSLFDHKFRDLSQGEQRLVLISAAVGSRPKLLVLDEPCQGLDLVNRKHVLGLVNRICEFTDMGLIYITHHLEEKLPIISHALHLKDGHIVFQGLEAQYKPEELDSCP